MANTLYSDNHEVALELLKRVTETDILTEGCMLHSEIVAFLATHERAEAEAKHDQLLADLYENYNFKYNVDAMPTNELENILLAIEDETFNSDKAEINKKEIYASLEGEGLQVRDDYEDVENLYWGEF